MTVRDTHCHFFTARFFEALAREKYGATGTAEQVALDLCWDLPDTGSARRSMGGQAIATWCQAPLIASVPGDEESVAAAGPGIERHRLSC
jgi:hypothetical protein